MATTKQTVSDNDLSTFGARLRHERDAQGLSRPALSKLTSGEVTVRVIDHLERGTQDATGHRAELLADALQVDKNWLMFGETSELKQSAGNDNVEPEDAPEHSTEGTGTTPGSDTGVSAEDVPEPSLAAQKTGTDRSETGTDQSVPVEPVIPVSTGSHALNYLADMSDLLASVDTLRKEGLQHHPRKMPKLIQQAKEAGEFLEFADIEELALERSIDLPEQETASVDEKELDELVLRLIDTAVLGIDLYQLDMDTLKAFASKYEIDGPFFGWNNQRHIISEVRNAYWQKAMEGSISLITSLKDAG